MNITTGVLGATSVALPLAVAVDAVPIPSNINPIVAMLIAAMGPACVGVLTFFGRSAVIAVSAYFRKRSELKAAKSKEMLEDKNKANDAAGLKLKLEAESERAAADALLNAASNMKGKE
jgi:hypothetical protein